MKEIDLYKQKDVVVAYLLWLFLGLLGAHKLYLGRTLMAVLYFFTGGLLLIGWIYDLFTLARQVDDYNTRFDDLFEFHDEEIESLEDEIDELRDLLAEQDSSEEINRLSTRVRDLERQLAAARAADTR